MLAFRRMAGLPEWQESLLDAFAGGTGISEVDRDLLIAPPVRARQSRDPLPCGERALSTAGLPTVVIVCVLDRVCCPRPLLVPMPSRAGVRPLPD